MNAQPKRRRQGLGQLTLVEHALCPLDARVSLSGPLMHASRFRFTDTAGKRQTAEAQVFAPLGLSAADEFFLWGLLALTCVDSEPTGELHATPHFCLSRLGCISSRSKGGKSYHQFRESIRRLAAVRYQNDRFYDPLRKEHRQVSFGFFSYSLPLDPASSRTWRFVWDPLFFELCCAVGGRFAFDLPLYRELDGATRRLFLLLAKVFGRRRQSPRFELRHLCSDVLGFSQRLGTRDMKVKLKRCLRVLAERNVIRLSLDQSDIEGLFEKRGRAWYVLGMERGAHFDQQRRCRQPASAADSPLYGPLRTIGFDDREARRIMKRFPSRQVQLWSDVTLAALEKHGRTFFSRNPQAYFLDNLRQAVENGRTPPDWFAALRHRERRAAGATGRENGTPALSNKFLKHIDCSTDDAAAVYEQVVTEMLAHFQTAGQPTHLAEQNARRFAGAYVGRVRAANS